jgi:hypothetical protein
MNDGAKSRECLIKSKKWMSHYSAYDDINKCLIKS